MTRIYLDHNATSPLRDEVQTELATYLRETLGNPSSIHEGGRRSRKRVDEARETVARFLNARPSEIVFTSGGTESNHLAWRSFASSGKQLLTTRVEHPSVLAAAKEAEECRAALTYLNVNREGAIDAPSRRLVDEQAFDFISIQHANNETGVIFPIEEIAKAARKKGALVHSDAVQSAGKLSLDVQTLGVDYLSLSGHKLGAFAGTGVLYAKKGCPLAPLWGGGHQEKGRRTGTENLPGILSIAAACRAIEALGEMERERIERLRDMFETEIVSRIPDVEVTGRSSERLCNTSHLSFEGVDGESLLIAIDLAGLDCSTGAACASGSLEPSPVLLAMGFALEKAHSSLRFSFGWNTGEQDVEKAIMILPDLVDQVRRRAA